MVLSVILWAVLRIMACIPEVGGSGRLFAPDQFLMTIDPVNAHKNRS